MRKIYVNELSEDKQNEILEVIKNNLGINDDDGLYIDENIILTSKINDLDEYFTREEIEELKGGQ